VHFLPDDSVTYAAYVQPAVVETSLGRVGMIINFLRPNYTPSRYGGEYYKVCPPTLPTDLT
jgi:hypothetical protein